MRKQDWNYLLEPATEEELDSLYKFVLGTGMECKCGRQMWFSIEGYWCPHRWWGNYWKHNPTTRFEI